MKLVGEQFQPMVHQCSIITLCCLKKTCSKSIVEEEIDVQFRRPWLKLIDVVAAT